MDTEQMFRLIDTILPFEACLYYQIIPVSLQGSCLTLGMVNAEDFSSLDYARRILAYLNCKLQPEPITSELHQTILSEYLNYSSTLKAAQPAQDPYSKPNRASRNDEPTLIVDSPERLNHIAPEDPNYKASRPPSMPAKNIAAKNAVPPLQPGSPIFRAASIADHISHLPALEVQAQHLSHPIEVLAHLPPKQLLQELLGRVVVEGIGRLYFDRPNQEGRILWSQNGVLQSVLENLSPGLFQGVINELKFLAQLPLITITQPKRVEIERRYKQQSLLLSLRLMPGKYGEEATLQVLRGAALKFHRQQHIASLTRDALGLGQQLQGKLSEIRERTSITPVSSETLPALNQLLEMLDNQLQAIKNQIKNQ